MQFSPRFFAAPQNHILEAEKTNVCSLVDTARFRLVIGIGIRIIRNTEIGARGRSSIPEIEILESRCALALSELRQCSEFASADDKAVRRCAYKLKRKAGDESQRAPARGIQDLNVGGWNDRDRFHAILKIAIESLHGDDVIRSNEAQRAEKRIAVAGQSDVARFTRQCRFGDMANRPSQSPFVGAFQDHRGKTDSTHLNSPERSTPPAGCAETGRSRPVCLLCGWKKGQRANIIASFGDGFKIAARFFKLPGLIGLINLRVEQNETAVTQRKDAYE